MTTTAPSQSTLSTASTLLLLDAENMDMSRGLEHFLATEISPFPVRYRYAFGNWRSLGERDRILHSRGYQLVHVPPAKNSADMHMALDGVALIHCQPDIRAVFICSNDQDFGHLSNTLIRLGMIPYRVYRHGATCQIDNLLDGTTCHFAIDDAERMQARTLAEVSFSAETLPFTPTAVQFSTNLIPKPLQKILQEVTQSHSNYTLSIGELGTLYRQCYGQSLRDALRSCDLRASLKEFLQSHADAFVLTTPRTNRSLSYVRLRHQSPPVSSEPLVPPPSDLPSAPAVPELPPDLSPEIVQEVAELTLALRAAPTPSDLASPSPSPESTSMTVSFTPSRPTITDTRSLETALVQLLWQLSPHQEMPGHISLAKLSASFQKTYQESLSQTLKRIGHPKSIVKFLNKSSALRLHQSEDRVWVGVARVA